MSAEITDITTRTGLRRIPSSGGVAVIRGPWKPQRRGSGAQIARQLDQMFGEPARQDFERMFGLIRELYRQRPDGLTDDEQRAVARITEAAHEFRDTLGAPALLSWLAGAVEATSKLVKEELSV